MEVSIVSTRRLGEPYGLQGGGNGACGRNFLIRNGRRRSLSAKVQMTLEAGDRIVIETPGGGAFGE